MTVWDTDVAVVGSGFGGGVAALRHAEAGRSVVVLEQGRRLAPADLAAGGRRTRDLLWMPEVGLRGYFRQTVLRHVIIVHGVGVGGGSIVYAAVLLRPGPAAWSAPGWAATGLDWATELSPHYDTAGQMLGIERNPHIGAQDRWLGAAAAQLGAAGTYKATPQGIRFADCVNCGACITGCPHGAKNTVDRTYLARAEALGTRIVPRAKAIRLARMVGGGWRIDLVDPLRRNAPRSSVTAREVVLSGGVLGTVELLLASRDRWRTLPWASPALGRVVRTNSEAFTAVLQPDSSVDVSEGPTISSDFHPDELTHVTNNRFPRSYGFMRWYLTPLVDGETRADRRRATVRALVRDPAAATAGMRARDWHRRVTVLTVMQHDDNEMALVLARSRLGTWGLRSRPAPGAPPIPTHLPQANAAARAVAAASGGTPFGTLFDPLLGIGATAHILGGAVIGTEPGQGVVDAHHRVFATAGGDVHEDLRVLDGSVVPANLGVNPALTITALAERAMALR
jgi:cholesterol oxidase